jgi:serine/threonine protein kinase
MYMSPEQLHGDRISAPSDVYAFGVIAYEMVTGRRPFNPITIAHLSNMQREGVRVKPADLRPRLPESAQAAILKALAFDPAERYQDADEFGETLSRALMNEDETPRHIKETAKLPSTRLSVEPAPPKTQSAAQTTGTLATPFQAAQLHTEGEPVIRESETRKSWWPRLAAGLVIAVILFAGGYVVAKRESLFGSGAKPGTTNPAPERSFAYSLTVQKMRNGKPYNEPFRSSGQEIFESGYKFRLNVSSPQPGYLYVFNEGAAETAGLSFTIIYPTPVTNRGSAKLDENQAMQTNWNTFVGQAGTEQFWIVWSALPVTQLEAARDAAFKAGGEITDAGMVRVVREFLTKHSEPKPETKKDTMKQQTDVRANGELLVKLVELEHR